MRRSLRLEKQLDFCANKNAITRQSDKNLSTAAKNPRGKKLKCSIPPSKMQPFPKQILWPDFKENVNRSNHVKIQEICFAFLSRLRVQFSESNLLSGCQGNALALSDLAEIPSKIKFIHV